LPAVFPERSTSVSSTSCFPTLTAVCGVPPCRVPGVRALGQRRPGGADGAGGRPPPLLPGPQQAGPPGPAAEPGRACARRPLRPRLQVPALCPAFCVEGDSLKLRMFCTIGRSRSFIRTDGRLYHRDNNTGAGQSSVCRRPSTADQHLLSIPAGCCFVSLLFFYSRCTTDTVCTCFMLYFIYRGLMLFVRLFVVVGVMRSLSFCIILLEKVNKVSMMIFSTKCYTCKCNGNVCILCVCVSIIKMRHHGGVVPHRKTLV